MTQGTFWLPESPPNSSPLVHSLLRLYVKLNLVKCQLAPEKEKGIKMMYLNTLWNCFNYNIILLPRQQYQPKYSAKASAS